MILEGKNKDEINNLLNDLSEENYRPVFKRKFFNILKKYAAADQLQAHHLRKAFEQTCKFFEMTFEKEAFFVFRDMESWDEMSASATINHKNFSTKVDIHAII